VGNVFGEGNAPSTLKTSFVDFDKKVGTLGFPYQPPGKALINGNFISIWLFLFGLYLYFPCVNMLHQCLLNVNIRKFL
jgi:hypothetical protein